MDIKRIIAIISMLLLLLSSHLAWSCPVNIDNNLTLHYYQPTDGQNVSAGSSSVSVTTTTALNNYDMVLVIQMQGADFFVDTSNPNALSYGANNGTGRGHLNNGNYLAGNWEYAQVASISGSTISFTSPLIHRYQQNLANSRKFQVIRVPIVQNYTMTADITISPWNGLVGGVGAFIDLGAFNFNGHTIHAEHAGFRGVAPTTNYYVPGFHAGDLYTTNANYSGVKGEGIAGGPTTTLLSNSYGYPNGIYGRGAPGNGGGAGNAINAGGAGGGNGGIGGFGGEDWNANSSPIHTGGIGGAVSFLAGTPKVTLGGAGGTGQQNNSATRKAGNGGGIVFLQSDSFTGTGSIIVDGETAQVSGNDGGSGGGAGGSIVLHANSSTASLTVSAKGGNGGAAFVNHGAAGGGGGGVILASSGVGLVATSSAVAGGLKGANGNPGGDGNTGLFDNTAAVPTACATLPVELGYVRISRHHAKPVVQWNTLSEYDHAGFQWYGLKANGDRVPVGAFKPAKAGGGTRPQRYRNSLKTREYFKEFILASIDTKGVETYYGPYRRGDIVGSQAQVGSIDWGLIASRIEESRLVSFGSGYVAQGSKISRRMRLRYKKRLQRLLKNKRKRRIYKKKCPKLQVALTGPFPKIFRVPISVLQDSGWEIENIPGQAIAIQLMGKPLECRVTNCNQAGVVTKDSEIIFGVAEPIEELSRYQKDLIAEVRLAPRKARALKHKNPVIGNIGTLTRIHRLTDDNIYDFTRKDDPWVDRRLLRRRSSAATSYTLTSQNTGPISVKARLFGVTDWPDITNEHTVAVVWNGELVSECTFSDQETQEIAFSVDKVLPGENQLTFRLLADNNKPFDIIYIDEIVWESEVHDYEHKLLKGSAKGFSVPWKEARDTTGVFAVQDGRWVSLSAYLKGTMLYFGGLGKDTTYYLGAPELITEVRKAEATVKLQKTRAQYLVLTHTFFKNHPKLSEFVERKKAQGYSVAIVDVQDVYDQYGHGNRSPQAIRTFLKSSSAEYVLLVGGDSYDYHHKLGNSISFIPTVYRSFNHIGQSLFDQYYVDFNEDGRGDIALGRWPVRTLEELSFIVDKTLSYEESKCAQEALVVTEDKFQDIGSGLEKFLSDLISVQALNVYYYPGKNVAEKTRSVRQNLLSKWSEGVRHIFYSGHGSPTQWGQKRILQYGDLDIFAGSDSEPASVTALSCYSTYFVEPHNNTLAHQLLFGSEYSGGAVCVQGGSTLTNIMQNYTIAKALTEQVLNGSSSWGKASVDLELPGYQDAIGNWTFLGDPSLKR